MTITIIKGDLFDCHADGLALTIDGSAPNLEGSIARQFAERYPNEWRAVESEISYPMPLGSADSFPIETDNEGCPRFVVLLSTLHHQLSLSSSEKQAVATGAIRSALILSKSLRIQTLACPLMTGGWRQQPDYAALQTVNTYFRASIGKTLPDLEIHVDDQKIVERIFDLLTLQPYLKIATKKNCYLVERV